MKIKSYWLTPAILGGGVYITLAFVFGTWNCALWNETVKGFAGFAWLILSIAYISYRIDVEQVKRY